MPVSPEVTSAVHKLPPLPPLTSYRRCDDILPSTNFDKPGNILSHSQNESGLNLSVNSRNSSPVKYDSLNLNSPPHNSPMASLSLSSSSSSPQSWLTALSGQTQGQKRPPPAHSNNQPPLKRSLLDKVGTGSPSSSNSNMSPLVDLDQLCSILDSDRDRNSEEIAQVLPFPSDFPLSMTSNPTPNGNSVGTRNYLNVSPSDIISLD